MKTLFTVFFATLFSALSFAQRGINYTATIKDSAGNTVINTPIEVQFSILEGAAQTIVYEEAHSPTTDANGMIKSSIGEGVIISGAYETIQWGKGDHFLNTQIDVGSGFADVGTIEFLTVPYAIHAENVSGLEKITEAGKSGWRLIGANPNNYGNIGVNAVDLSMHNYLSSTKGATGYTSFASGNGATAEGSYSIALGNAALSKGYNSIAMGFDAVASGSNALAIGGISTRASGSRSIAMGTTSTASGKRSVSIGNNTKASAFGCTAIGGYNVGGGNPNFWSSTNPLFEVGNGYTNTSRHNAFTILKNGRVGIGTATPKVGLHITTGKDANLGFGSGFLLIGNEYSINMLMDQNEIMVRQNGIANTLFLQRDGGNVWVGGHVVHSSDMRLKQDIETLSYGLSEILQLKPKAYHWKNREQKQKYFGLIAQEVQPILKEVVQTADDEMKTLSISYTELIPVLIKAIQEQQKLIDMQNTKIGIQSENYKSLIAKLKQSEESILPEPPTVIGMLNANGE